MKKIMFFILILFFSSCVKDENDNLINESNNISIIDKVDYLNGINELREYVLNIKKNPETSAMWLYSFDYQNDGDLDVLLIRSGRYSSPKLRMFLYKNENNRYTEIDTGIDAWGRHLEFEDLNNDGLSDIFVADHGYDLSPFPGAQDQIIYQNSNGNLIDVTNEVFPKDSYFSHGSTIIDAGNDGLKDILINCGGSQIMYKNDGKSFIKTTTLISPSLNQEDGNYGNYINGEYSDTIWYDVISGWWSNHGDFNNDGYDDIIIGGSLNNINGSIMPYDDKIHYTKDPYGNIIGKSEIILFQNPTNKTFEYKYPDSVIPNSWEGTLYNGVTIGILVEDFNSDGCLDYMTYSSDYSNFHKVEFKYGNCRGGFNNGESYNLPKNDFLWEDFEIVDIDNDGDKDVVISNNIESIPNVNILNDHHVVLINKKTTFWMRLGEVNDIIYLPPHIAVSWYLGK